MNKSFTLLTVTLLLGGYQSSTRRTPDGTPPVESTAVEIKAKPEKYGPFSEDSLYSLLVVELAEQYNCFDIALSDYVVQTQKTHGPGVSERAFRIAEYFGADQGALDTFLFWARSAPDNLNAQRATAIQLVRAGRYEESMVYMEKVLSGQSDTHFNSLTLPVAEIDPDTRAGLLQSFDHLSKKYPDNGQLLFGKALLLQQDDRPDETLALLEDNSANRHKVAPLLLRSRLLQSMKRGDETLPLLKTGIKEHPDSRRVRLACAHLPVEQDRLGDVKAEFAGLAQQFPDDDDSRFSLTLVCLEAQVWDEARIYLEELVERDNHVDTARFNLGRLAEEQKDTARALDGCAQADPDNDFLPAQLRRTDILLKADHIDEAAQRLDKVHSGQPDYAIQLYLIETKALSNNDQQEEA